MMYGNDTLQMMASRDFKVQLKFSKFFSNSLIFFSIEAFGVEIS